MPASPSAWATPWVRPQTLLRLLLLDPRRAARSAGRVAGVLTYRGR